MDIHEAKANSILNTKMRYPEGVMTRREWINLMRIKGAKVEESTKPRIYFNRTKYNRMSAWEQEEYEKKCNEKVPCYNLRPSGETAYFEITKTEYDYFNSMELADDLATQRESDPQPEIEDFFLKYI